MSRLLCLALLLVPLSAPAAAPFPLLRDSDGEPLPAGARLRLGTVRWSLVCRRSVLRPLQVLSADRKLLACDDSVGTVQVFDTRKGRRLFHLDSDDHQFPLAFSHDGKFLAIVGSGGGVHLWPVAAGSRSRLLSTEAVFSADYYKNCAAFLAGDKQLATWDGSHLVVWDVATGKERRRDRLPKSDFNSFSPDGRRFASQVGESVVLADLTVGRWVRIRLPAPKEEEDTVYARWSWSADGRQMAVTTWSGGEVRIHDTRTGRLIRRLPSPDVWLQPTAFSPDGRELAEERENQIRIWDLASGKPRRTLKTNQGIGHFADLAYRDDRHLLMFEGFGFVRTWDTRAAKEVNPGEGHRAEVCALAFSADGGTLVSLGNDGFVRSWDVRDGRPRTALRTPDEWRDGDLSLSADGRVAAIVGGEQSAGVVDLGRNRVVWQRKVGDIRGSFNPWTIRPAQGWLSRDGSLVVLPLNASSAEHRRFHEVREAANGQFDRRLDLSHRSPPAFAPDASVLASTRAADSGVRVQLIDPRTGRVRQTLAGPKDNPELTVTFSPDGRLVGAVSAWRVYLWERASGKLIDQIELPESFWPRQTVITHRGRVLIAGSRYHERDRFDTPYTYSPGVWDMETRKFLRSTPASDYDCRMTLCPQGRTLAVGCGDSSIVLFDVPVPRPPERKMPNQAEAIRLWGDLGSADAGRASRARRTLADHPGRALPLLRERVQPAKEKGPGKLLADLDSEEYAVRQTAMKKLAEALKRDDRIVEVALRDVVESKPALEVYRRARQLLEQADSIPYTGDEVRLIRAVAVLEDIGSADAIAHLKKLAAGAPSVQGAEAKAALKRLGAR